MNHSIKVQSIESFRRLLDEDLLDKKKCSKWYSQGIGTGELLSVIVYHVKIRGKLICKFRHRIRLVVII